MLTKIRKVTRRGDDGASAVEYGLLVAAIAALVVIIVFALGGLVQDVFKETCDDIKTETSTAVNSDEACTAE
jgi:pilus assembly protein Flp/PilA